MNITVVIGTNFGDEGKGLMTDFFANQAKRGVVVRFNGGCQAGHTVVTPDGKRHVFGHVGSGAFAGLPTYLTKHFIVNPILFNREYEQLFHNPKARVNLPWRHSVYVQPDCIVTTVYDMLINQTLETFLAKNRHGSCGLGINETVERSLEPAYQILISDSVADMVKKLQRIQLEYVPERLNQLGIGDSVPAHLKPYFSDEAVRAAFVEDFKALKAKIQVVDNQEAFLRDFDNVIFEGAQGLLLDQGHPYFPHVTRSNTGIKNVVEILQACQLQDQPMDIVYVTRCYLTRHGAGPFPTETKEMPYARIKDLTNIPNEFQGILRFGLLDINDLAQTIKEDVVLAEGCNYRQKLAVTCLDQMDEQAQFVHNGKELTGSADTFLAILFQTAGIQDGYLSYGPNRNDIRSFTHMRQEVPQPQ